VVLQVEQLDHLLRPSRAPQSPRARVAGVKKTLAPEQVALAVRVAPDQQVVQHRRVFEQLDVLEGARDAQRSDGVRRLLRQRDGALALRNAM
jgi:hypothetical protein